MNGELYIFALFGIVLFY